MKGSLRILLSGSIGLIGLLVVLKMGSSSAPDRTAHQQEMERFYSEAERRNRFINGLQQVQGVTMWIDDYHHQNYELPTSIDQLRYGLPEVKGDGPDQFAFDREDGSVSMFFNARQGIEDGVVTFTPTADENNERLSWECWSSDYPDIKSIIPTCTYYEP